MTRKDLIQAHPDHGGSVEALMAVHGELQKRRRCAWCRHHFTPRRVKTKPKFCGRICATKALAAQNRRPRRLKGLAEPQARGWWARGRVIKAEYRARNEARRAERTDHEATAA